MIEPDEDEPRLGTWRIGVARPAQRRRRTWGRPRFGLQRRVTALFGLGALVISAGLALAAYEVARHNVLSERERTAVRAASFDAAVIGQNTTTPNADLVDALSTLDTGQGRRPFVRRDGAWFARGADDGLTKAIPPRLIALVDHGQPAVQRIRVGRNPVLIVGTPLSGGVGFYEASSLREASSTLRTIAWALAAAAGIATVAGGALGLWASRRLLAPLRSVSEAAALIAAGDLSIRLDIARDPDLAPLAVSFNQMVDEVSSRIEKDQRFAADVSHELRSPLQTLSAAASVLSRRSEHLDDRSASAATLVAAEVDRFTVLVTDLLELAKNSESAALDWCSVPSLLANTAVRKRLDPALVHVDPAVQTWRLDERRVERILDNLIENAEHHGGGVVQISATIRHDRERGRARGHRANAQRGWDPSAVLHLSVDDAGPGVPVDERHLIFDRFARGRAAFVRGQEHGTGLGLSIAQRHTAAHQGRLLVGDRPGGGARFTLEIPATWATTSANTRRAGAAVTHPPAPAGRPEPPAPAAVSAAASTEEPAAEPTGTAGGSASAWSLVYDRPAPRPPDAGGEEDPPATTGAPSSHQAAGGTKPPGDTP